MDNEESAPRRTVPPLKIRNVRSLQTVHISDEDETPSTGDDTSSDNENLIIDEVDETFGGGFTPMEVVDSQNIRIVSHDDFDQNFSQSSVDGDVILVVDEAAAGADDEEDDFTPSSRRSSNRQSSTNSEDQNVSLEASASNPQLDVGHSSKGSRRKSHHVPKQVGDVVFEEATILTVPDDEPAEGMKDPNKNLMKHIAMLKSCINYVLEQQDHKPITFKHNFESASKLIEHYNQMKINKLKK